MKTKLFDGPTQPHPPPTLPGLLYVLGAIALVAAMLTGLKKKPEAAALFAIAAVVALAGAGVISELHRIVGRVAESPENQAARERSEADAKKRAGYE